MVITWHVYIHIIVTVLCSVVVISPRCLVPHLGPYKEMLHFKSVKLPRVITAALLKLCTLQTDATCEMLTLISSSVVISFQVRFWRCWEGGAQRSQWSNTAVQNQVDSF